MKKLTMCFLTVLFLSIGVYAQTELRMYMGLSDYPGISVEQTFDGFGFELGGSFRRKAVSQEWHGPIIHRTDKSFVNFAFKKYFGENRNEGFYAGAYIRWRMKNEYVADAYNFTAERKSFVDSSQEAVGFAKRGDKVSIGALIGKKWLIHDRVVLEANFGFGFSPFYKETFRQYYRPNERRNYDPGALLYGSLDKLSVYSHLIIGYRFGN